MGNTVSKLHAKFHQTNLITKVSNGLKYNFFRASRKTVLGNIVEKLHAKFHPSSLIRNCLKLGELKKCWILFLEQFLHIPKSHKNPSFANFIMRFSVICIFLFSRRIYKYFGRQIALLESTSNRL